MIRIKSRNGQNEYWLNVDLIETILECEGNTSEIILTNGHIYRSIEPPNQIANRVAFMKMSSELSKPRSPF